MNGLTITRWDERYARAFYELPMQWLREFDLVEPIDLEMLLHPKELILEQGGQVFFALYEGKAIGTVAMMREGELYEAVKFTVAPEYRRRGVGRALLESAVDFARERGAEGVLLYSNSKLTAAQSVYKAFGFVPQEHSAGMYELSDIQMYYPLRGNENE